MRKKAEEKAREAYPVKVEWVGNQYGGPEDVNRISREGFQEGYEQAEKETAERAIAWLKENANRYIVDLTPTYPDAPANIIVGGMCWEHLKDYLQNE